jgi:hypothetical protein
MPIRHPARLRALRVVDDERRISRRHAGGGCIVGPRGDCAPEIRGASARRHRLWVINGGFPQDAPASSRPREFLAKPFISIRPSMSSLSKRRPGRSPTPTRAGTRWIRSCRRSRLNLPPNSLRTQFVCQSEHEAVADDAPQPILELVCDKLSVR